MRVGPHRGNDPEQALWLLKIERQEAMKTAFISILCVALIPALLIGIFVAVNWAPERSVAELQASLAPPPSVFVDVAGMRVHLRDEGPREDATSTKKIGRAHV